MTTWLIALGIPAVFSSVGLLLWYQLDWWLEGWRDEGVDCGFERTREEIRGLPESVRPFDWERDAA